MSDASGTVLGSFVCVEDYDVVVVSCAGMVSGGSYTITAGSDSITITMDSVVYDDGGSGTGGGMGQMQGGPGTRGTNAPTSPSSYAGGTKA